MMSYTEKIKTLFFHSKQFFQLIKEEKKYQTILKDFLILYIIGQIIGFVFSALTINRYNLSNNLILTQASITIFSIIFAVVIPFIFSGITHLGVLIFGGKNGFFKTFKPATYAIIIGSIYGILISVVSYFLHLINPIVSITIDQLPSSRDMPLINSYVLSLIGLISL